MDIAEKLIDELLSSPRWRRCIHLAAVGLVALFTTNMWFNRVDRENLDLRIFLSAARNVINGNEIYSLPVSPGDYIYLPLFCVLLIPLTPIKYGLVLFVWNAASVCCVGWIVSAFYGAMTGVRLREVDVRTRWAICFFSVAPAVVYISDSLRHGQPDIFLLTITVYGICLIERGSRSAGGAILGVGAVLKVFSGVPLTVYFVQRKIGVLAGAMIGIATGLVLPAVIVGFTRNIGYIRFWVANIALGDLKTHPVHFPGNGSLQALMYRLFSDIASFEYEGTPYFLTIVSVPETWLQQLAKLIFFALLALLGFYVFRYRDSSQIVSRWGSVALACTISPLITGVAEAHHFVFLLPAYILVVHAWVSIGIQDKLFRSLVLASFALGTLGTVRIWGEFVRELSFALCKDSIGAVLLAIAIFRLAELLKDDDRIG